ncbi:MAG: cation:proton antiporter [Celeribacter sp.]|jgi:CPA2 family monovalent cation:H+ antiporter-2
MEGFFYSATIYLTAAVVAVPLASRLGLGSVLGYLLAGIAIGPILDIVGSETEDIQHFAEFGVVMMLFLIGLELEPRTLWEMRHKLLGLGGAQVLLTVGAVHVAAAVLFDLPWNVALATGLVLALSSTAIVLQTLNEKGLMRTLGGRSSFSVLLTQDVAVIPMLVMIPLLPQVAAATSGGGDDHGAGEAAVAPGSADQTVQAARSLVESLPGWGVALVTLAAVGAIVFAGRYLTAPLFRFIHMSRLREMYTATALLIVVSIALLMSMVGISPALGAFLAGVLLATSEFRHELEANIEPFKGLLLGLFFITVGAGIDFEVLLRDPAIIIGATLSMMAVKGALLYALGTAGRMRGRDRWLFTLGLAQAGEFGFVLISFSLQQSVLPASLAEQLLLVIALSMLLTPLFFIGYELLSKRATDDGDALPEPDEIDEQGPVIIAGIGRFGQVVNRMVQMGGVQTTVLDHDLATIQLMRKFGFKGFFGDPTRPELLHAAGLREARVLVVALDDTKAASELVRYARSERPDLHIVARARDRLHVYELYRAGANDIIREMFDSSLRAARYVLENMDYSDFEAKELERAFYRHDRTALRELAKLWDPLVPVSQNEAYIARARELDRDLETALVSNQAEQAETENSVPPGPSLATGSFMPGGSLTSGARDPAD